MQEREKGNVLFMILIAVALFAALSYVVAQMMRGGSPQTISGEKSKLLASEILDYARALRQGVQTLRINGCADTAISFENPLVSGYDHTPAASVSCQVFHTQGGGAIYARPPETWLDPAQSAATLYGQWYFPAGLCVPDTGSGASGCESDSLDNEELVAVLPYLRRQICIEINDRLGLGAAPLAETGNGWPAANAKFTGAYSDGESLDQSGRMTGCFEGSGVNIPPAGTYHFFQVLSAR